MQLGYLKCIVELATFMTFILLVTDLHIYGSGILPDSATGKVILNDQFSQL